MVQVDEANQKKLLHPGEQLSTSDAMAPAPIKDEIAWSRDVNQHLALLGEFTAMQKQLEQLPGPGLRYSSALLPLVPDGTVLYVAIPNIGGMLANAQQIFQDRLNQSATLRDWWNSQHDQAKLTQLLNTVQAFSSYLGNEVVVTVAEKSAGQYAAPLVMAQVTASGFQQYLQQQVSQIPGGVEPDHRHGSLGSSRVARDQWRPRPVDERHRGRIARSRQLARRGRAHPAAGLGSFRAVCLLSADRRRLSGGGRVAGLRGYGTNSAAVRRNQ